jgi:heme o synthase
MECRINHCLREFKMLHAVRISQCRGRTLARTHGTLAGSKFSSFFSPNKDTTNVIPPWPAITTRGNTYHIPIHAPLTQSLPPIATSHRQANVLTPSGLLNVYSQLAKSRLTTLVVLTAMSGVALSPLPTSVPILLSTAVGTALCSASANTLNQLQEVPFDAQMARTRTRPLVRDAISPIHAATLAVVTGIAGPAILWTMSPVAAILGAGNIALYAGLYTWLKRRSVVNTWVGSVVGAIPPLMGWSVCGGSLLPASGFHLAPLSPELLTWGSAITTALPAVDNSIGPWALFMLLFSWQFPHFNSLSHLTRGSYAQAGYHMLSVVSPQRNSLVALRHALLLVPVCSILTPFSGLTTWAFALTSLVPNAICVRAAWRFWQKGGEKEAKACWNVCLWYLPVVLGLMMVHKKDMEWLRLGGDRAKDDAVPNPADE